MNRGWNASARLALEVLRSEGPRATLDRLLDRLEETRRLWSLNQLDHSDVRQVVEAGRPPVLNLSPVPLSPGRGGSQIQMLDRLKHEHKLRPTAVAYPADGALQIEIRTETLSGRLSMNLARGVGEAVAGAAKLLSAPIVHVENLHLLPLGLNEDLEVRGIRTVLSVHDFTLFCSRPHLIERATGRFCEYSTDPNRCNACLRQNGREPSPSQNEYRHAAARALRSASAVIYPSQFTMNRHHELLPESARPAIEDVISPATHRSRSTVANRKDPTAVAFVGGFSTHKGGALIPSIVERIRAVVPRISVFVYGNGEDRLAREIRTLKGVHIRGYYRRGRLPELLARDHIGAAAFPSIWPEAYGLVVDECLSSNVPVVAFDLGAVGERLKSWGVGRAVPLDEGSDGIATALLDHVQNLPTMPRSIIDRLPQPEDAAAAHVALYERLLQGW